MYRRVERVGVKSVSVSVTAPWNASLTELLGRLFTNVCRWLGLVNHVTTSPDAGTTHQTEETQGGNDYHKHPTHRHTHTHTHTEIVCD